MKKAVLFLCSLIYFSCFHAVAQKLEKNEVDKFTKKAIKATSWEKLIGK